MRKIKKINGYLVVKFNDRERREWESLGTYGVIDAELYTGTLEVDRSVMEYDDADSLEVAVELARGLESELDVEEPDVTVTVTVIKETDYRTTEKKTIDPEALFNAEKKLLERQILSYHYPDTDHRAAAYTLHGFARALLELGIIEDGGERFSVTLDTFDHVGPKAPNPHAMTHEEDEGATERETFKNIPPELKKDRDARRLYSLGLALEGDCPQNDCALYRNIFRMAQELDSALDTLEGHAADVLRRELLKNHRELREMYLYNYAIQSYKEEMQP